MRQETTHRVVPGLRSGPRSHLCGHALLDAEMQSLIDKPWPSYSMKSASAPGNALLRPLQLEHDYMISPSSWLTIRQTLRYVMLCRYCSNADKRVEAGKTTCKAEGRSWPLRRANCLQGTPILGSYTSGGSTSLSVLVTNAGSEQQGMLGGCLRNSRCTMNGIKYLGHMLT